jgi:LPS sulfotransferase NodH
MVQGLQYPMNDDQYEALVLDSFQRMYEGYSKQKDSIPAGQLIEIRYEDLIADPLKHLEELYKKLGWDGFEQIRPKLEERLQQDRDYQVNRHNLSDSQEQKVKECCEAYMKQYGYWN